MVRDKFLGYLMYNEFPILIHNQEFKWAPFQIFQMSSESLRFVSSCLRIKVLCSTQTIQMLIIQVVWIRFIQSSLWEQFYQHSNQFQRASKLLQDWNGYVTRFKGTKGKFEYSFRINSLLRAIQSYDSFKYQFKILLKVLNDDSSLLQVVIRIIQYLFKLKRFTLVSIPSYIRVVLLLLQIRKFLNQFLQCLQKVLKSLGLILRVTRISTSHSCLLLLHPPPSSCQAFLSFDPISTRHMKQRNKHGLEFAKHNWISKCEKLSKIFFWSKHHH